MKTTPKITLNGEKGNLIDVISKMKSCYKLIQKGDKSNYKFVVYIHN